MTLMLATMNADPKDTILKAIEAERKKQGPHMTWCEIEDARVFLRDIAKKLVAAQPEYVHRIVEAWHDLHRTGVLSFGYRVLVGERNLNEGPHDSADKRAAVFGSVFTTGHGQKVLEHVRRDPSNPAGYIQHIESDVPPGSIARSYVDEALRTYAAGCDRATTVLIGCAAEAMTLDLRDALLAKYSSASKTPPKGIAPNVWQIRTIIDGVRETITQAKTQVVQADRPLWERFEFRWTSMLDIIRHARNEVGHPTKLDPITHDDVHALLLIFPEAAKLSRALIDFATNTFAP